jgi:hypothetical protein
MKLRRVKDMKEKRVDAPHGHGSFRSAQCFSSSSPERKTDGAQGSRRPPASKRPGLRDPGEAFDLRAMAKQSRRNFGIQAYAKVSAIRRYLGRFLSSRNHLIDFQLIISQKSAILHTTRNGKSDGLYERTL